ncbi:MAG: roadblock/LC7 domain-containing protein [Candidatus Helarchaeota archaeon]
MSLEVILKDIKKDVKVYGSILINISGIPLAADLPQNLDKEKIAMIITTVLLTSEKGLMDNDFGTLDRISIRGEKGEMFLFKINDKLILAVLGPRNISYGILILSVKNAINRILSLK